MVKKKAKEDKALSTIQQPVTSNKEEKKVEDSVSEIEDIKEQAITSKVDIHESDGSEHKPDNIEEPKKLKVLAADRLNSLISEANELGITDIVEILNSDKYGQFYMVYRQ